MNITEKAFDKKQFVVIAIVLICIAGLMAYFSMTRAEDPLYVVKTAKIITKWPGASPQRVEELISDKLEIKIQEMPEIDYIKSESKTGISIITVNILDKYLDIKPIWQTLRNKVEDVEPYLPETAEKPIVNDEYGDIFGIVFGLTWDGFDFAQMREVAKDIRDEILLLDDVAKVDLWGIQQERVYIDYDNDKLKEISLSVDQLQKILRERNIIQSGGMIYLEQEQIAIEPTGNYISVDDIKSTLIPIPDTDKLVFLSDIADVYRGYIYPPESLVHSSGEPSIAVAVSMKSEGNILILGDKVQTLIKKYKEQYPVGIEFDMLAYEPRRVDKKIKEFVINLFEAVLIVCVIMLFTLGLRTGIVVSSLIPMTILVTFMLMKFFNFGLNQITLASLIIALGMLVDNAIVMSESILVQVKEGMKPKDAACSSAKELFYPLLSSSLTTSAAFLPFFIAKSKTGEFVGSLFIIVTITLLASWVLSLTLIPIFSVWMIELQKKNKKPLKIFLFLQKVKIFRKKEEKKKKESLFFKVFEKLLFIMLRFPKMTMLVIGGVFIGSMLLFGLVPKKFYPADDTPMFTAEIKMPVGSSIFRTEEVVKRVEKYFDEEMKVDEKREEGIANWSSYIGNGGPRYKLQHDPESANPYYAFMLIHTTSYAVVNPLIQKLEHFLFENFPDLDPKIRPIESGTPVDNPIEVRISGKDENILYEIRNQIKEKLSSIRGTKNIGDDWGLRAKKVVIHVDQTRARRASITNSDIAVSLESALEGVALTELREDDKLIPIVIRSVAARDVELISTEAFNVYSQETGAAIPLAQVADIEIVWEPAIIFRRDKQKTMTVYSAIDEGYTANAIETQLVQWIEEKSKTWPLGYRYEMGGENEESGKAQSSIYAGLPIAGLIIIVLLMAQFNSLKKTFIILFTIPLSFIGVVWGLFFLDSYFGVMSILGVISLAGIVINNAIVLLDRIRIENEENNRSEQDAIIAAVNRRMRPIFLATSTTIVSLIPLYLGGGLLWEPMALSIMAGLLVSTILTLGIVPVLYALFFKISFKNYKMENSNENRGAT